MTLCLLYFVSFFNSFFSVCFIWIFSIDCSSYSLFCLLVGLLLKLSIRRLYFFQFSDVYLILYMYANFILKFCILSISITKKNRKFFYFLFSYISLNISRIITFILKTLSAHSYIWTTCWFTSTVYFVS